MSTIINFPVVPRAVAIEINATDEHAATRLARVFRQALVDAEASGIGLDQMRTLLINALQYIDAKIAMGETT